MKTHCPNCGEEHDKPQPDDYWCGKCIAKLVSDEIGKDGKPIVRKEDKRKTKKKEKG